MGPLATVFAHQPNEYPAPILHLDIERTSGVPDWVTWLLTNIALKSFYELMLPYLQHDFTNPKSIWKDNRYTDVVFRKQDITAILLHRQHNESKDGAIYMMLQHTVNGFSLVPYVLFEKFVHTRDDLLSALTLDAYTKLGSSGMNKILDMSADPSITDSKTKVFLQAARWQVQNAYIPLGL